MKKGRPPGRRRKPSPTARVRPFWVPIAVAALTSLGAGAFVVSWSGFRPRQIVVTGNAIVPRAEILARAAISGNVNMWLQNTGAIADRVRTIPYVSSARVFRLPPASIVIVVRERVPFAVVASGDSVAAVDRDLRVLQTVAGDRPMPRFVLDVPEGALQPGRFLTEAKALAMRDDYEAMIAAHVVPLQLQYDRYDGLVATVRGNVRILFGDDGDLEKKLPLVDPILAQVVRKQQRVAAVDLRAPRTPVLVFK
ncbi:MAG TPA: FtsQ-type POTRA domain-containing protein [Candidatus Tumulicola sp.]